jgi:hypothetical protein
MKLISIKPSTNNDKKLMATFEINGRQRTTHFGAKGMILIIQNTINKIRNLLNKRKNHTWQDTKKMRIGMTQPVLEVFHAGYFGIYLR